MQLLTNVDLYDPEPRGRAHLLIGGERILWVGDQVPSLPSALGATVRDMEGRRVIPGLIDGASLRRLPLCSASMRCRIGCL